MVNVQKRRAFLRRYPPLSESNWDHGLATKRLYSIFVGMITTRAVDEGRTSIFSAAVRARQSLPIVSRLGTGANPPAIAQYVPGRSQPEVQLPDASLLPKVNPFRKFGL